ncbi:hypothetical protein JYU34_000708, partial [Plutella xylostella]
ASGGDVVRLGVAQRAASMAERRGALAAPPGTDTRIPTRTPRRDRYRAPTIELATGCCPGLDASTDTATMTTIRPSGASDPGGNNPLAVSRTPHAGPPRDQHLQYLLHCRKPTLRIDCRRDVTLLHDY